MNRSMGSVALHFVSLFLYYMLTTSSGLDTIGLADSIRGNNTLVSSDGSFELGFFCPADCDSGNWYLGIWYKKISIQTVAWVANRETPLFNSSSGILHFTDKGILVLENANENVWSINTSRPAKIPVLKLLDSGNLVIRDGYDDNPVNILWQSFDHPGDTLFPGMKLGRNLVTGQDRLLTSWKSATDPAQGEFSCRIDTRGFPQLVIMKGQTITCRGGSWNGLRFTGTPELKQNQVYGFEFVSNENEVYYKYELRNNSVVSRLVLNQSGLLERYFWTDRTKLWNLFLSLEIDHCDHYAKCGEYASCNIDNAPVCSCLKGFVPRSPKDWSLLDWSNGCVRSMPLDCESNADGFIKFSGLKLPDTSGSWFNTSMNLKECEQMCLKSCSCSAYANSDIRDGGSGCLLWFGGLIDIREFADGGQDLYVRMASTELDKFGPKGHSKGKKEIGFIVSSIILVIAMVTLGMLYRRKRKPHEKDIPKDDDREDYGDKQVKEDTELATFDLATIEMATNNFSNCNKLGEGGFGPVYRGVLMDGQEIAVKRLSKSSGQGPVELKNEVTLISKLQHRNLVKLLGCCIQGEEKMLIYEYLPNKSLDFLIFGKSKSMLLNWQERFKIIGGIARGLLYLHHDSRLRIIHRDLKASNILLDTDLNPKISDFGVARTFGGDDSVANTTKVVGTYGYMSPEYAIDGIVSVKTDVFSFGVLLLEIVSGKRNRGFYHPDHHLNLLGHAWRLWKEERPLELLDKSLLNSSVLPEVLRCIHVGLLCVQQLPEDRPNMSSVVVMLGSENSLPEPKKPGFYAERNPLEPDCSTSMHSSSSVNEITNTMLEAR